MKINIAECDVIYLSYDEPNAEKNYYDLLTKIPWAKRVHGVKGSDAAHKACAKLSETQRFVVIDGDNIVKPEFINQSIEVVPGVDISKCVISWTAYNLINGLTYGNGSIKSWDKDLVLNMKTHENADVSNKKSQVDFCWDIEYIQSDECMSYIENNFTPRQAWRAGFREGVKMCLVEGIKPSLDDFKKTHWKNLHRLYVWCMVGADVKNGLWAILGARQGLYKTMCTDWDYVNVRDFEYLNSMWYYRLSTLNNADVSVMIEDLGVQIEKEIDIPISPLPLNDIQSKFFKSVYINPKRVTHPAVKSANISKKMYDIIMITYNEPNANENFANLQARFPNAKRIHGVKGIHQAHIAAAEICDTEMMWIVDGDAVILDSFSFDYIVPESDLDAVHVWRSLNPVNDLEYGYGGVKLLPTMLTKNMDISKPDMTTSISTKFKKIEEISNVTKFNITEFDAWKSGFRECCKLASAVIDRQRQVETNQRLERWCSDYGKDRLYGQYAIDGAIAGRDYGKKHAGMLTELIKINDFDWLENQFNNFYKQDTIQETSQGDSEDIKNILDRFEILYQGDIEHVRRFYNDKELSSLLKLQNNEDLRKAVLEKNLYSIFRLVNNENLRKAILYNNLSSISALSPELNDIKKLSQNNDMFALWRILDKHTNSRFVKPLKTLYMNEINYDKDCLSRGQILSKQWLVENLPNVDLGIVFLCAGWYATLVPMLVEKQIKFNKVFNFDVDPTVWKIAEIFNKELLLDNWRFKSQTLDIHNLQYTNFKFETIKSNSEIETLKETADTIINTSCEHIDNFSKWYNKIPKGKFLVLQSNNYFSIDDHINCSASLQEFSNSAPMEKIFYEGELVLEKYTRFMKIGIK